MSDSSNVSPEDLAEFFAGLSDEYLLAQAASRNLTETAQALAERELGGRGIALPPVPEEAPRAEVETEDFVTVASFFVPTEAFILCGRLEAEGIPAIVTDANLVQANNLIALAVGGVRVQVPVSSEAAANDIVAALRRGEYALREGADPEG